MHFIRCCKIALAFILLYPSFLHAQERVAINDAKFERRLFHFGIHVGFNTSDFKIRHSESFIYDDEILGVRTKSGPGFNLHILGSIHLHKNIELRVVPGVAFSEKSLMYDIRDKGKEEKKIESIVIETPLHLKFKSDPIRDFKMYVFAGMKYGYDMASNSKARRAEDLVKLNRHDLAVDYGVGFEIHFPMFILAPEFKVSNGIRDIHSSDEALRYSKALQGLRSRVFSFSINFEG